MTLIDRQAAAYPRTNPFGTSTYGRSGRAAGTGQIWRKAARTRSQSIKGRRHRASRCDHNVV